ncbi:MAG: hypothetical protein A2142_06495 [candidate division Zixibacteria bacterium RBG_16_48_11]|nr:MAG: hypothetical protein A2142_06495 [candidate division Zixibacteria bacterium RBG_16_48_11]
MLYLASSFILGVLHAIEPGHGKTIVAAYLVGSKGKPRHAVALGAIVTFTHTIGIIILAVLAFFLARGIDVETLHPFLELGAAVIVIGVGVWMLRRSLKESSHHHEHSHQPTNKSGVFWKDLIFLGISGGIVPCPAALAVLLTSITAGKPESGLLWVLSFSLGLAVALVLTGIMVTHAAGWAERKLSHNAWLDRMPLFTSVIILLLGGTSLVHAVFGHFI